VIGDKSMFAEMMFARVRCSLPLHPGAQDYHLVAFRVEEFKQKRTHRPLNKESSAPLGNRIARKGEQIRFRSGGRRGHLRA